MDTDYRTATVAGLSMHPILQPNDIVFFQRKERYSVGSILVYQYGTGVYLIHRLLYISRNKYFCKGDNSFRLEGVFERQILGQVVCVKRGEMIIIPSIANQDFIKMSLKVHIEFIQNGCNNEKTRQSRLFREYKDLYLK